MADIQHSDSNKPIVIVGGGVTGLVTAHILSEQNQPVIVVEKLATLGGLARSFRYDNGYVFDCGRTQDGSAESEY